MLKISNRAGSQLFSRLATGYHAGLDLRTLWQREAKSIDPRVARQAETVLNQLGAGATLGEAMSKTDGYFSPLAVAVVKAGEASGRLEQSFRRLANHYETWHRFRRATLVSLAWPMFELGLSIFIIGALILLMGWATSSMNRNGIDWFGWGWGTWDYFRAYVALICSLLTLGGLCYVGLQMGWFGSVPGAILRRIPLIGGVLRNLSLARFSWALSSALGAGMNTAQSLSLGAQASQDGQLIELEPQMTQAIVANRTIYETLAETKRFPDEFLTFISNAEISGELPETLDRLSGMYQERVETGLGVLKVATFVMTFLFVATLIGGAVIFLYMRLIMGTYRELGL
jgi:type IV pilus assembly protein PilC